MTKSWCWFHKCLPRQAVTKELCRSSFFLFPTPTSVFCLWFPKNIRHKAIWMETKFSYWDIGSSPFPSPATLLSEHYSLSIMCNALELTELFKRGKIHKKLKGLHTLAEAETETGRQAEITWKTACLQQKHKSDICPFFEVHK